MLHLQLFDGDFELIVGRQSSTGDLLELHDSLGLQVCALLVRYFLLCTRGSLELTRQIGREAFVVRRVLVDSRLYQRILGTQVTMRRLSDDPADGQTFHQFMTARNVRNIHSTLHGDLDDLFGVRIDAIDAVLSLNLLLRIIVRVLIFVHRGALRRSKHISESHLTREVVNSSCNALRQQWRFFLRKTSLWLGLILLQTHTCGDWDILLRLFLWLSIGEEFDQVCFRLFDLRLCLYQLL